MSIEGKHVAIMLDQKYQELEVWYPLYRLVEAGANSGMASAIRDGMHSKNTRICC